LKTPIAALIVLVTLLALVALSAQMPAVSGPPCAPLTEGRYNAPGDYLDHIPVDGLERLFSVHVPPGYRAGACLPLVVNIHGRTSNLFEQEAISQINAKADEAGFISVHPQALGQPPTWWGPIPNEAGQPDLHFFQALIPHLQREVGIDPARIYATGLSNGATMANRLGCAMPETFAAIAPVSGGHVAYDLCETQRPVPVVAFHGLLDPIIPYEGNQIDTPPVRAWMQAWAERNGCDPQPLVEEPQPAVTRETWRNCALDAQVVLYSMADAGHTWFGSTFGATMGGYTLEISATDVLWDFFEEHPLRP
jgi:polyhydroxybutyrate depolymerase